MPDENIDPKKIAKDVAIDLYGAAKKKYEKSKLIVEEGELALNVILNVEGEGFPHVEVSINGELLGYINDPDEQGGNNCGKFVIECYKRGSSNWDKKTVNIIPVMSSASLYKKSKVTKRLGGSASTEKSINIYIPVALQRAWYGLKKSPVKPAQSGPNN
mgnify:CR=1 FL=1